MGAADGGVGEGQLLPGLLGEAEAAVDKDDDPLFRHFDADGFPGKDRFRHQGVAVPEGPEALELAVEVDAGPVVVLPPPEVAVHYRQVVVGDLPAPARLVVAGFHVVLPELVDIPEVEPPVFRDQVGPVVDAVVPDAVVDSAGQGVGVGDEGGGRYRPWS